MTEQSKSKLLDPTVERVREVLSYCPTTGICRWKVARPGTRRGAIAGTLTSENYYQVQIDRKFLKLHRVIWVLMTGRWPDEMIDHINHNRADNRWENLREATHLENCRNRDPAKTKSKSGRVGVSWLSARGRWNAYIGIHNRTLDLGCFEALEDAIEARCAAEKHFFGSFASFVEAAE
jgi:hypothetical protein